MSKCQNVKMLKCKKIKKKEKEKRKRSFRHNKRVKEKSY